MTTNLSKDSDLPKGSATGPHSELITAAEQFASLYDGDDREYIKTDVLNSFYAGWDYARKAIAAQTAQAVAVMFGDMAGNMHVVLGSDVPSLAQTNIKPLYAAPPTQAIAVEAVHLWKVLQIVRNDLERANNDGKETIADTIWHTGHETLFDYIDSELHAYKHLTHHTAPDKGEQQ